VGGDVITRVQGTPVRDPEDLSERLQAFRPGQVVSIEVVRDGKRRTVRVRLGERPQDTGE
jgi:serine protease Do